MRPGYEFRRLIRDVENPERDGRARHGIRAALLFRSGMPFLYSPAFTEPGAPGRHPASISTARHSYEIGPVVAALVAASELSAPQTWAEVKLAEDAASWAGAADAILQGFLETGAVTIEQLSLALRSLQSAEGDGQ
jgi:hypothetical protein